MNAIAELGATLPIGDVLEDLQATLVATDALVLEAPPGAGKTTLVPLVLLDAPWLAGRKIIMLEPRRVAARAAAARMAELLGEAVGETVGYRVRLESKISAATRVEVITEGILSRMLLDDPALSQVAVLIFDEFHERSLDADLGLALALQGRELFREPGDPLKLVIMSATLDGSAVSALLGSAPVLRSEGRSYPVELAYAGSYRAGASIVEPVIDALKTELSRPAPGAAGVLVFLPGQREIRLVASGLGGRMPADSGQAVELVPLHGGLNLAAQQRAIAPAPAGIRKIVLATNIAETSLTIADIGLVIDGGLAREPRFDPRTGLTRLHTCRISRDASIQRMGRAGRVGPGRCIRLWSETQQGQLSSQRTPEILQADLLPLVLQLLGWGVDQPGELQWLDEPPAGAFGQALSFLAELGAVCLGVAGGYSLTTHGEAMGRLPLHPRLAHMLLRARESGCVELACDLAALQAERDPLTGAGVDINLRLAMLRADGRSNRPGNGQLAGWRQRTRQQARRFQRCCGSGRGHANGATQRFMADTGFTAGLLLAEAYPDRLARVREAGSTVYQLANGRAAALADSDDLRGSEWLVVADLGGPAGSSQDRIYSAAALDPVAFDSELCHLVRQRDVAHWDDKAGRFVAERQRCIGALVLGREPLTEVPGAAKREALLALVARKGLHWLPWTDSLRQWQGRVVMLRAQWQGSDGGDNPWPDVSDEGLLRQLPDWLGPALDAVQRLPDFQRLDMRALLIAMLPWPLPRQLEQWAPTHWQVPSGSRVAIDYTQQPPVLAVKLQEMFGCTEGPRVANGRVAVMIHLLSPARRPLQITTDLAGFWAGSYQDVKKEMKGRYPRHPWPDDPLQAEASRYTKHRRRP